MSLIQFYPSWSKDFLSCHTTCVFPKEKIRFDLMITNNFSRTLESGIKG